MARAKPTHEEEICDYLEALARESFNREIEQDETIWNALPFFAAGIGLILPLLANTASKLPTKPVDFYLFLTYALVLITTALLAVCGYYITVASISRRYLRPPYEEDTMAWVEGLKLYYRNAGSTPSAADAIVLKELKAHVLKEFSAAATQNRRINYRKAFARGRAMIFFLAAAGSIFTLTTSVFIKDKVAPLYKSIVVKREEFLHKPPSAPSKPAPPGAPTVAQKPLPAETKPLPPKSVMILEQGPVPTVQNAGKKDN